MSNLYLTFMIAFILIIIAIAAMAVGWLITGRNRIERGACGRDPTQKKDGCSPNSCSLCSDSHDKLPKDEADEDEE